FQPITGSENIEVYFFTQILQNLSLDGGIIPITALAVGRKHHDRIRPLVDSIQLIADIYLAGKANELRRVFDAGFDRDTVDRIRSDRDVTHGPHDRFKSSIIVPHVGEGDFS